MRVVLPILILGAATTVSAQLLPASRELSLPPWPAAAVVQEDGAQVLLGFDESNIKFNLQSLMEILRDHQHEGWVLAAYPDPNTQRPLIGAGFSLDVPVTIHPQPDPLNPHPFVEPSTAQLWRAAGLDPDRLQQILDQFDRDSKRYTLKQYRRRVLRHTLTPQLTEDEGLQLLRISTIQAVYNARAYCRNFDDLTASQQMALSQLVFQMGTNLEQFVDFLGAVNDRNNTRELAQLNGYMETDEQHWHTVQRTLMESQWARRYTGRASSVIAMFDPSYYLEPAAAEQRVEAVLRPPEEYRPKSSSAAKLRVASYSRHTASKGHRKKASHLPVKRKLT
jgi:hypothetical protein